MPRVAERREQSLEVSPRVTLRPGDKFRVSKGPYWKSPSGEKHSLAVRGVCVFRAAIVRGKRLYVEAVNGGSIVTLHVRGRRQTACDQIVARPYKITGRVGVRVKRPKRRKRAAA